MLTIESEYRVCPVRAPQWRAEARGDPGEGVRGEEGLTMTVCRSSMVLLVDARELRLVCNTPRAVAKVTGLVSGPVMISSKASFRLYTK